MIKITDIQWDTDGEDIDLPKNIVIEKEPENEDIADYLSDTYGFCVFGFKVEEV